MLDSAGAALAALLNLRGLNELREHTSSAAQPTPAADATPAARRGLAP